MEGHNYKKGFVPYGLAAFLIGIVGGFSTIVGPAFVSELGIAYNNTTWTALAQAMSTAACAPILGKLGDILGRKRTLMLGLFLFTTGNILTVLTYTLPFMLLARFIIGIGTAAMAPVILSYILTEFPQNAVAKGFSLYMLISSASVIFGPALGGLINARFGWRSTIRLCVVICIIVLLICLFWREKKNVPKKNLTNFDGVGAIFVLLFFSLLLCIPSFGQNFGWQSKPFTWVLIAAAGALVGLLFAEKRAKEPILPGTFMKRSAFILSILALFLTQGLMQANMTNTIIFVDHTQPENSVLSGYAISVMYLGMSIGAVLLGPLADRFEPRSVLIGSFLLTGCGCGALLLFSENTALWLLMASLGILGFGLGANGTIFMKVALGSLSPAQTGAATGTYGLFRDLAAPFGVAVFVPLFTNQITADVAAGAAAPIAAVGAIHHLALAEIICVVLGLIAVLFLPHIQKHKGESL